MVRRFRALALLSGLLFVPLMHGTALAGDISAKELRCLALTVYWEAKGEGRHGMEAVAAVVLNRVRHPAFPNTVCGVVRDGKEKGPCQFSWWCDGKSDWPQNQKVWLRAEQIARQALSKRLADPTGGSLYYHHTAILPSWRKAFERVAIIGRHAFYR